MFNLFKKKPDTVINCVYAGPPMEPEEISEEVSEVTPNETSTETPDNIPAINSDNQIASTRMVYAGPNFMPNPNNQVMLQPYPSNFDTSLTPDQDISSFNKNEGLV